MRAVGFAALGSMVAYPFVGAWLEAQRAEARARRVGRIIEAAERDGRVAR